MWKDAAVSLSLANLCFLAVWSRLLVGTRGVFGRLQAPSQIEYATTILNVLLLAGIIYCAITVARRKVLGFRRTLVWGALFLSSLLPLQAVSRLVAGHESSLSLTGSGGLAVFVSVGLLAVSLLAIRHSQRIAGVLYASFLILSPFVPVTFIQAGWRALTDSRAEIVSNTDGTREEAIRNRPRVVWVVFDEWDQRLTFDERPGDLELPELDRLRGESIYATHAYAPAEQTHTSMLSLLTGEVISGVRTTWRGDLLLSYRDSPDTLPWNLQRTLFSNARAAGLRGAVVGWHVPYCPLLSESLTSCWWDEMGRSAAPAESAIARLMSHQWQEILKGLVYSVSEEFLPALYHSQLYRQMLGQVEVVLTQPDLNLILLHLPVPHPPNFYDRFSGEFSFRAPEQLDYFDSLALVDRTVGELRARLEEAGLWHSTTVLLGADHWLRDTGQIDGKKDHRVPFLLKLAGQRRGVVYDVPFNTVLTHDMLWSVLRGELSTPQAVVRWLDREHGRVDINPVYSEAPARSRWPRL